VSRIASFSQFDSWIITKPPIHLVVTNVDRDHLSGAVLQKAICESPRRRAHVETRQPLYLNRELAQGSFKFQAASAHKARLSAFLDSQSCGNREFFGGFIDTLIVDEYDSGHHQRLGFGTRVSQTLIDENLVDALALHARYFISNPDSGTDFSL
jgi:hypothetical protein